MIEEGSPIFIGEVIEGGIRSLRDDPWYADIRRVRFKVVESFRGLPPGVRIVDLEITPPFGMCSPIPYCQGKKYLVFPRPQNGKLHDGACFQGRDIETAAQDVRQVRDYFSGQVRANLVGRVALTGSTGMGIPGVTVLASRGRVTYPALTDSEGRFELRLPATGVYQIRADLFPYQSQPTEVFIPGSGCAAWDLGLTIDTSIAGRVVDRHKAKPVKHAEVGLVRLDRVPAPEQSSIVARAYSKGADLSYKFTNVPLGRYLIVFNPDGPRSFDLPFERTFYPGGATRTKARTVEVNSAGTHLTGMNVAVGKRVRFRKVVVRVRFPNGAPMTTAEITCVGVPLEESDLPWLQRAVVDRRTGLARFMAPANQSLELKVLDWHGRDLRERYTSRHAPGTTPINQDFLVMP